MKPWERRLKDLGQILTNCSSTYFDPDLFRMNTNQFLQTARTVTFIIQKNKSSIPDYDAWYQRHVIDSWRGDDIMQWAKESRNTIEKEGDLSLHSTLRVTLIFSYLEEQDVTIDCGCAGLLNAGVKKLVRLAQKQLPTGVSDAAAVKMERRWVANSLPTWELLHALAYIYTCIFRCCEQLTHHLDAELESTVPASSEFDKLRELARQVAYVKLRGLGLHRVESEGVHRDPQFKPPDRFRAVLDDMRRTSGPPANLHETVHLYAQLANATFQHFGNHVPMLFVFDDNWRLIDMLTTYFEDQADKFIFWRTVADRLARVRAHGAIWIAESWLKETSRVNVMAIRNMPIVGERLHVVGFDKTGAKEQSAWEIIRTENEATPELRHLPTETDIEADGTPFFLVPAMRALGIANPTFLRSPNAG
jgi:hypothetical protein